MKANEVPKKIYLQVCGDCNANDCENCKFEDLEDNVTWCKDKIFEKDIEYVRKDAFIEKAAGWLSDNTLSGLCLDFWNVEIVREFVDNFRNAMKL